MDRWRGQVAVVTGASAGIGLATAKALVREGMIVVGLARREDKMIREMENAEGTGKFYARKCDVSREDEVGQAFDYVRQTFKSLSVLVNNAGTILINSIEAAETSELDKIISLNLMGPVYCSKQAIKLMKENGNEGYIINMNSYAGHKVPHRSWFKNQEVHTNVYSPSKFGLTALSEVLINELLGNKIRVTNLSPGYVVTEISQNIAEDSLNWTEADPSLLAEDIANTIVYIIGTPAHVQITQLTIKPLGERF